MKKEVAKDLAARNIGFRNYAEVPRSETKIVVLDEALNIMKKQVDKSIKKSEEYKEFLLKLNEMVDEEDSDTCSVGEFVMEYFNLWK